MALSSIYADIAEVKNTLGESNYDVVLLASSNLINKWSKKKPIRDAVEGVNWPAGIDGKYGLDIANLWSYLHPRGGSPGGAIDEPGRLEDFRGYEHDQALTLPPAYVRHDGTTFVGRSEYSPTGYYTISGTLKLNTGQVSEITLADLGLAGYYFGMCVSQPSHGAFWYKTLGVVAADNQYISGSIAMSSPYTSYNDFPFLFQDSSQITVAFVLASAPATAWTSGNTGLRLPHEIVAGIDMRSSYNMTIAHWIIPGTSNFTFLYMNYSLSESLIHSDINASTLAAGFVIISKPSWLTVDVYDTPNNRVATGAYYNKMSVRAIPSSNNMSTDRTGNIVLGDTSSHELAHITVLQQGKPATAYCTMDGFTSSPAASASINSGGGSINVTFTPVGLSATAVNVGITILRDGTYQVAFDASHTAKNGVQSTFTINNISPAAQRGYQYQVIISNDPHPYMPE